MSTQIEKKPKTSENSESLRSKLMKDFEKLQNRKKSIDKKKGGIDNVVEEQKGRLIRSLFEMMQQMGVDPNNLESIAQFRQNLEIQDPDLAELFETAFTDLLSEGSASPAAPAGVPALPGGIPQVPVAPQAPAGDNAGLMNKFSNLGQNVLMPSGQ